MGEGVLLFDCLKAIERSCLGKGVVGRDLRAKASAASARSG